MRPSSWRPVVHLVHPPPYGEVPFKHLGLAYVAAGLRARGFETHYHDVSERYHRRGDDVYDDLILRLSRRAGDMSDLPFLDLLGEVLFPDHADSPLAARFRGQVEETLELLGDAQVVAMSFNTLTSYFAAALGRALRKRGVRVVMGGPLSSIPPIAHLLLRLGAADAIVAGEGDLATGPVIEALLEGHAPVSVPGAVWLAEDRVIHNPGEMSPALDDLPWPQLEGNVLDLFIPVQASRGCSRRCLYCSETGIWGTKGYRRRDPASVVREMRARAEATGLSDFHFHDDLLNCNSAWMDRFVGEMAGQGFAWESFFEPYGLDEALLQRMADTGCRLVKFGIQSFSPSVLRAMGRAPRPQALVDAVVATYRAGMSTHYDMLIGHPGETEDDHQINLRVVEELYGLTGDKLYFSLNPFYLAAGSEIERDPKRFGVQLVMADPGTLPRPLAEAVAAGPAYPVGYRSEIPREITMRRMKELAEILRNHGKDYLYLGQEKLPDPGPRGRRMLPPLPEDGPRDALLKQAEALGRTLGALPILTLGAQSNLRLSAGLGALRPLTLESATPAAGWQRLMGSLAQGSQLRIAGGEPTVSEHLPQVLMAARRAGVIVRLETNGIRFSHKSYARALVRLGLTHVAVVLLDINENKADRAGGVNGSFALALEGIEALTEAGVQVEVGLLATNGNITAVPKLAQFVHAQWRCVRTLHVLLAPVIGAASVQTPAPELLRPFLGQLLEAAAERMMDVIVEARVADEAL